MAIKTKDTITMDVRFLYEKQYSLDSFIDRIKVKDNNHLSSEEIFEMKMVALLTEIGEFINEHRGFKYWSENNRPRTKIIVQDNCKDCNGTGYLLVPEGELNCHCLMEVKLMYEEFADTLHFMLSLGNSVGHFIPQIIFERDESSLERLMINWFHSVTMFDIDSSKVRFNEMLICFGKVAHFIGLTEQDIHRLYNDKYKINIKRQKEGY